MADNLRLPNLYELIHMLVGHGEAPKNGCWKQQNPKDDIWDPQKKLVLAIEVLQVIP